jgi:hypothetical protein
MAGAYELTSNAKTLYLESKPYQEPYFQSVVDHGLVVP